MPAARLRAYAKLNLTLEVLNKRADGFHNLRTIFQTVSLHDIIDVEFKRSSSTCIELESNILIPGENLITKTAEAVLRDLHVSAHVRFRLTKRIPMGGGLGGGSTDAAAVLAALPVLAGYNPSYESLLEVGSTLGSDVPFFLLGGTALGLGRGTELYPLPELHAQHVLLVAPDLHVSTPDAYRALNRTAEVPQATGLSPTDNLTVAIAEGRDWRRYCHNDFEPAAFSQHPQLRRIKKKLLSAGAETALMTGSGAVVFGIFDERAKLAAARELLAPLQTIPVRFISRRKSRVIL